MNFPLAVSVDDGENWITDREKMGKILVGIRHIPTLDQEHDIIQSYKNFSRPEPGRNLRLVAWKRKNSRGICEKYAAFFCPRFLCEILQESTYQNLYPHVYSICSP